jgi:hypothetical protein
MQTIGPLNTWFHVKFDHETIYIQRNYPNGDKFEDNLNWKDIIMVMFETTDTFWTSDNIYLFSVHRPESYVVPTEADGGLDLWGEILQRKLFDAELAIKAASTNGELFMWPPIESEH